MPRRKELPRPSTNRVTRFRRAYQEPLFLFDAPQRMAFCGRGCDVDLYVNCVEGLTVKEVWPQ